MLIRLPRIARMAAGSSVSNSLSSKRMLPATMRPAADGTRRMTDSAVTDLPHPLSPTTPSVSPRVERQRYSVHRLDHAVARVEMRAQPADGEYRSVDGPHACGCQRCAAPRRGAIRALGRPGDSHGDRGSRSAHHIRRASRGSSMSRNPSPTRLIASTVTARNTPGSSTIARLQLKVGPRFGHDVAPARNLRRRAGTEETQRGLDQHGRRADVGRLHDQRRQRVGQQVPQHDARHARADRRRGLDIGLLANGEHDAAHQAHDPRHFGQRHGDDHDEDARLGQRDQRNGEHDRRNRHHAVHHPHHHRVHRAQIAADEADRQSDQRGESPRPTGRRRARRDRRR